MSKTAYEVGSNGVIYLDKEQAEDNEPVIPESPIQAQAAEPIKRPARRKPLKIAAVRPARNQAMPLLIGSGFGLLFVSAVALFGIMTTFGFLVALGFSLPLEIPLGDAPVTLPPLLPGEANSFRFDLVILFPVGLNFFQIVYRPPLSLKGAIEHMQEDPATSLLWLFFTCIGIGTSFFGLLYWLIDRNLGVNILQWPVLITVFITAACVEYLCEPYLIKFWTEFCNAAKALMRK